MSAYGSKLDPYRKLREPLGVKGIRQSVVITNNPSTIDQNQQLLVRFPNLSNNDVIVPRTARLVFTIELTSKDANATVYQNLETSVNALAFTGGNFLFSKLGKTQDAEKERERHDKAVEQLEAAQAAWSQKRVQRLDFINEQIQIEHHAGQTFDDVDQAMK